MEPQKEEQVAGVHPLARWLAGLFAPMSLRDQRMATRRVTRIFCVCFFFSLLAGCLLEKVCLLFYGVGVGCVVSLILFVPNWYQQEDTEQRWCDEAEVKEYYRARQQLLDEIAKADTEEELQAHTKEEVKDDDADTRRAAGK
ncbi:putative microsomal signal peptidase subunit [Trypanosoma rangeli]|uniref:Putative microsomal signal peptidase subunit n=1 Tax=Trypanosoma rangeli TaxID=5698 RepID=A0A3R7NVV8_TRYRA|nr:putative microsomal signal peptidase subunit [Trypanosoma rangeli]RNF12619.1 putative microsomal signal peptidase subunit [Trypanosoma rangeli]|eukprot:RNF12619.1 putative microsomal signal peptidase subunit [Trypanosoma rangeli]